MEKTIAIRIDEAIHRQIKIRLAENEMTLKDYIIYLVNSDLKDKKPFDLVSIPNDNSISLESVREAQKVLDFAYSVLASQEERTK